MPLSEHEQRVLAQLEESLTRQDPQLAKTAHAKNVYVHAGRRVRQSILGFIVGLVILVLYFSNNLWLGLLGVAIMFGFWARHRGATSLVVPLQMMWLPRLGRAPHFFVTGCRVTATKTSDREQRLSAH